MGNLLAAICCLFVFMQMSLQTSFKYSGGQSVSDTTRQKRPVLNTVVGRACLIPRGRNDQF